MVREAIERVARSLPRLLLEALQQDLQRKLSELHRLTVGHVPPARRKR